VSDSRRDEALNFQAKKITEEQFDMEDDKKYLLEAIKDVELFKGIDNVDYDEAIEKMKFLKLKAEDYIFKPGDSAENMYVIHKGTIKVFHNTIDGREQILYLYHENDFVGGHNILEDVEYIYMGQALTDCEVIMIPRDIFNKYLINSPLALTKILKKSFERIRLAEDLVQRLSTSNATMKTAALLLRLKDTMGVETKDGIRLDLAMNREELGNYSGLTRETITRKLGEFKKLGYIDLIGTKVIVIKNVKILEELVL
ncbi:MAG: Crp/Fnr family transcriptional regulator, partial [Finegoldia magna]